MEKALFLAAFFFAYTVQAITGFAGNIFAMPVGTTLLGLESTVSILNAMGFFACGLLTALNIKSVNWRELGKILGVMIVFMVLGIWLDTLVPLHILLKIYGVIIVIIGIKNLAVPQQKFMPEWALWIILALAGLIQGMFVSGGALLVIYAVQKLRDQQQFRITLSAVWTVLNLITQASRFSRGTSRATSSRSSCSACRWPCWPRFWAASCRRRSARKGSSSSRTCCCCASASSCWLRRSVRRRAEVLLGVQ